MGVLALHSHRACSSPPPAASVQLCVPIRRTAGHEMVQNQPTVFERPVGVARLTVHDLAIGVHRGQIPAAGAQVHAAVSMSSAFRGCAGI
jgi:hypothetical protein